MSEVDRLFEEYVREHRAGGPADPVPYLDRLEGTDREELVALIDAYLVRSPGRPWDEEAFRGSAAERVVESLTESLAGESGSWPSLLPSLRDRARIKREQLVERLAAALGVQGKEEKVADYYNRMEHGRLAPEGVDDRVLDALAAILGTTREALREAGRALRPPEAEEGVFARTTYPREARPTEGMPSPGEPAAPAGQPERDEVDELFLGG